MGQGHIGQGRVVKILLLGSNHRSTAEAYQQFGLPASDLVTHADQSYTVGHTSRQEFASDAELEQVLSQADSVYWTFSDVSHFASSTEYYVFLNWLKDYQLKYNNIVNFYQIDFDPYNWKIGVPMLTQDDAVFLGCSFTAGAALPGDNSVRYANIVAREFDKNCVNLSQSGGSNNRSIDIFGQLKFVEGQLVVLQLTMPERLRYVNDNDWQLMDIRFAEHSAASDFLKVYNRNFLLYELLVKLRLVVGIARAKKLRFLFWLNDYKNKHTYTLEDQMYFYAYPEFIPKSLMENFIVDRATDNLHPGVESNKIIANTIINYARQIYGKI
jgi:hypothetical protein